MSQISNWRERMGLQAAEDFPKAAFIDLDPDTFPAKLAEVVTSGKLADCIRSRNADNIDETSPEDIAIEVTETVLRMKRRFICRLILGELWKVFEQNYALSQTISPFRRPNLKKGTSIATQQRLTWEACVKYFYSHFAAITRKWFAIAIDYRPVVELANVHYQLRNPNTRENPTEIDFILSQAMAGFTDIFMLAEVVRRVYKKDQTKDIPSAQYRDVIRDQSFKALIRKITSSYGSIVDTALESLIIQPDATNIPIVDDSYFELKATTRTQLKLGFSPKFSELLRNTHKPRGTPVMVHSGCPFAYVKDANGVPLDLNATDKAIALLEREYLPLFPKR